ncbi:uncharacterized protein [Dermacentor andersoni]|uniref:uncharacterized protein n=1 Tax=Dermacentor andersoni TaxID=34620 RepID=UPI002155C66B|nr:uncharacterized protein C1orf131 homolog [Dermacentor andersoni]
MGLSSRLLKKLYDYGDSFLDDRDGTNRSNASKLRQKKSRRSNTDERRKCTTAATKLTEIERMRLELGLDDAGDEPAAEAQTRPALEDRVPVVVFKDPTKRKANKHQLEEKNTCSDTHCDANEISFKKARHDVLKFGIQGLEKPKQEEAKIALAVQLGAKPPKNNYLNYKELITDRKDKKVKEREERILNARMGLKPKRQGNVRQRKTSRTKHEGVHYVSKELISQVKHKIAKTK